MQDIEVQSSFQWKGKCDRTLFKIIHWLMPCCTRTLSLNQWLKYWHARNYRLQMRQGVTWLKFHSRVGQASETHRWSYTPYDMEHGNVLRYGHWQLNPLFTWVVATKPGKLETEDVTQLKVFFTYKICLKNATYSWLCQKIPWLLLGFPQSVLAAISTPNFFWWHCSKGQTC